MNRRSFIGRAIVAAVAAPVIVSAMGKLPKPSPGSAGSFAQFDVGDIITITGNTGGLDAVAIVTGIADNKYMLIRNFPGEEPHVFGPQQKLTSEFGLKRVASTHQEHTIPHGA